MKTPKTALKIALRQGTSLRLQTLALDLPATERRRIERRAVALALVAFEDGHPVPVAIEMGVRQAVAGYTVLGRDFKVVSQPLKESTGGRYPELMTWLQSVTDEEGRVTERALQLWGWPDVTQVMDKQRSAPFIDGPLRQAALQLVEAEERLTRKILCHAQLWGDPALLVEIAVKSAADRAVLLGEPYQAVKTFRRWQRQFGRIKMAAEFARLAPAVLDKLSIDMLRMLRKDDLERADVAAAWAFQEFRRRTGL